MTAYTSDAAWEALHLETLLSAALEFHDQTHGEFAAGECDAICEPALAIREARRERWKEKV